MGPFDSLVYSQIYSLMRTRVHELQKEMLTAAHLQLDARAHCVCALLAFRRGFRRQRIPSGPWALSYSGLIVIIIIAIFMITIAILTTFTIIPHITPI